jgi:hypothetical protein
MALIYPPTNCGRSTMTEQKSFSDLLQAKLNEDAAELEKAKKAIEEIEWRQRVNTIANWLRKVFNDDSFELLAYKLKRRKKSREGDHFLTVYVRVGNLVFGLETSQNLNRYKTNFGICVLRTGRSGVSSQLFKLQQIYKENNALSRLEFEVDFSDLDSHVIALGTAQGMVMRQQLLEEIVTATMNVVKRRPKLLDDHTVQCIVADLPKHSGMKMLTDAGHEIFGPFIHDEEAYLASLNPELLNMTIEEMMGEHGYPDDIHKLLSHGVVTVRGLIGLTYKEVNEQTIHSYALIRKLAEHDVELKPNNGALRLAPGIPKSVDILFETSGLKDVERPRNCLARMQISSTRQLIDKTPSDLLAITNFGDKSLAITKEALKQHGLRLQPSGPVKD